MTFSRMDFSLLLLSALSVLSVPKFASAHDDARPQILVPSARGRSRGEADGVWFTSAPARQGRCVRVGCNCCVRHLTCNRASINVDHS